MIRISHEAFDPGAELTRFSAGRTASGAVVSFVGLARGETDGRPVLELESYPGFTEDQIAHTAQAARRRFALDDVAIVHRVGAIAAGEAIVLVLTAAPHRREAFEACDFLMDWLKSEAPLWKKEFGPAGARWVEPTARDGADLRRWREGGNP